MKNFLHYGILASLLFAQTACSDSAAPSNTSDSLTTTISECKETVDNDNAAYSRLACNKVGDYALTLSIQSPNFFEIELTNSGKAISSDFYTVANEMPVEPGDKILWLLENKQPKYAILELSWGTEDAPFEMTKRVLVNKVEGENICTLGISSAAKSFEQAKAFLSKNSGTLSCAKGSVAF